jgi:alpha-beta hydrolase superfamily lysophospholipase
MKHFPLTTHRQVRANGIELHCAETGDANAPLLIFLHGFPEFSFAWRDYMTGLAGEGFHVVAPDQRGYNLSEKPRGIDAYRLDTVADDITDLASALGQETFQVVGHDWGGSVAWTLANRHSSRVMRMVVLNALHPAVWLRAMKSDPEQRRKSGYVRLLQMPWLPEADVVHLPVVGHWTIHDARETVLAHLRRFLSSPSPRMGARPCTGRDHHRRSESRLRGRCSSISRRNWPRHWLVSQPFLARRYRDRGADTAISLHLHTVRGLRRSTIISDDQDRFQALTPSALGSHGSFHMFCNL